MRMAPPRAWSPNHTNPSPEGTAMAAEQGTLTTRPAVTPNLEVASLEGGSAFLRAAGLVFDEITATRVTGHLDLNQDHHTPWGIVHGGAYPTPVERAARPAAR